jgi:flagellar assembly protein FliH
MTLSSNVIKAPKIRFASGPVHLLIPDAGTSPLSEGAGDDLRSAASEVISRAKEEAQAILDEAQEQRGQIFQEARDSGFQDGLAQGMVSGRTAAADMWLEMQGQVQGVFDALDRLRQYAQVLDPELVLAQAAALSKKFMVARSLEQPDMLRDFLTALLGTLEEDDVTLFLSPTFERTLRPLLQDWGTPWKAVTLAADRQLQDFEVRVQGASGQSLLAGPATSLTRMLNEVLYGDDHTD